MDGYLDRVEMSTLGLFTVGHLFPRAGVSAPGWGGVAARTQRAVNAPLNASCLIPFYKGQEGRVYPRNGKGVQ